MYDIIIIGAGPAGISASIYAVSRGLKTLLLEKNAVGGVIGKVSTVTHYTGIVAGETGHTFAHRMEEQARNAGVEICFENVVNVDLEGEVKRIHTNYTVYEAKKVILANGTTPRKLEIPGENELTGKGMTMNAAKHSSLYAGKHVFVVGGADGAIKEAIFLAKIAKKVTIIHFEETLSCIPEFLDKIKKLPNVEVLTSTRLQAIHGKDYVESIDLLNIMTQKTMTIHEPGCGIFVYAGATPNTALYKNITLHNGYIVVNDKMETSIPGVYAAGDICAKQIRQVATAVNDGTIAAINAAK